MRKRVGVEHSGENRLLETAENDSIESEGLSPGVSNQKSGLDRTLHITKFDDPHARRKGRFRKSLRELAASLPGRIEASKGELPLLKLATFGDQRSRHGSLRHNANVLAIEGVEGDYDGERMPMAAAAKRLRKAGVAAMLYTSPSHRPHKPRWRVLCPTSQPLPPSERDRLIARVMGVLGGSLAGESFSLSQCYFYGQAEIAENKVTGEAWDRFAVETKLVEGEPIDLADDLDAGALDKHGKPYRKREAANDDDHGNGEALTESELKRIREALDVIPAERWDTDYWEWLRIGMALHNATGGSEEGLRLWDEASQWGSKYDAAKLEGKWDGFSDRSDSVKIGTLFSIAKQCGWRPKRESFGKLTFLTTEECQLAPPRGYIVNGLLTPGDVACIFGPPGAGKSLIAPHIGYQVALGQPAFGMRTKPASCSTSPPKMYMGCKGASRRSPSGKATLRSSAWWRAWRTFSGMTVPTWRRWPKL